MKRFFCTLALYCALAAGVASAAAPAYPVIPDTSDKDLRLFYADGRTASGAQALAHMSDAGLILWVAGNQFFAMPDVIAAYQAAHPGTNVGLMTLPPGLELEGIKAGGFTYLGVNYPGRPDVYATVDTAPLAELKAAGLMSQDVIYMHNELQLLVARGNPKHITSIDDLVRPGVRSSLPNPLTEGIMTFYARKVLIAHGIYGHLTNGRECTGCQTTPDTWFTAVHHRETPQRIADGVSDVGIVWQTEAIEAIGLGAPVDRVVLPPADSLRNDVNYFAGPINANPAHAAAAAAYVRFLSSSAAQQAYQKYGFVGASPAELQPHPI